MHKYKVRYTLKGEPMKETVEGANPIGALDKFHKSMQITSEIPHTDYKLLSLGHVYNLDPTGNCKLQDVESRIDLPNTPNPDLVGSKRRETVKEVPMPFMADLPRGRLSA